MLGVLFGHAFKSARARVALLRTIMAAAWVRALLGIYTSFAVFRPAGITVEYVTTHSDTILAVVAILAGLSILSSGSRRDTSCSTSSYSPSC